MQSRKIIVAVAIIVCAITFFATKQLVGVKTNYKVITKYKIERIDSSNFSKKENIIFLGDSITDFYPVDKIYWNLPIVKSGVSGYTTTDILDRMDKMVYQYNPTKVFLLIGTNDIMTDGSKKTDETIDNIIEIINNINKNRKKATIYVESIYPVRKKSNPSMVKDRDNDTIRIINEKIKNYCEKKGKCIYINMFDELTDENGELSQSYSNDGLHPNDLGYAKISQVRINYIYKIVE